MRIKLAIELRRGRIKLRKNSIDPVLSERNTRRKVIFVAEILYDDDCCPVQNRKQG
jgi:hypothetical protein